MRSPASSAAPPTGSVHTASAGPPSAQTKNQAAIKVVDEMEARGFLTREPHPTDRRAKQLTLTDRGHAVRAAALAESHAWKPSCALRSATPTSTPSAAS
jgi:hypothetical protein